MSPPSILVFFLFASVLSGTYTVAADDDDASQTLTAYRILQSYDFPVGLLPQGVTNYDFDPSTGEFTVYLDGTCSFSIEDYDLRYRSTITGVISKDRLSNLNGISVRVFWFLWLNIVEVTRDEDEIDFSVGIASANFAIDNFYDSPQCGCGFDCDDIKTVTE